MDYIANVVYIEAKERSKELLDISKAKLDDVDDELRRTFQAMEEVRNWIFCNQKARVLNGVGYGQSGKAHERSADQLRDELETLRQKLELVLGTDPGVIEQYERRKEEVRSVVLLFPLQMASNGGFLALTYFGTDNVTEQKDRGAQQTGRQNREVDQSRKGKDTYASS